MEQDKVIKAVKVPTFMLRLKNGRIQRAFSYRPWVDGIGDSYRLSWEYLPIVTDDAPDDEEIP